MNPFSILMFIFGFAIILAGFSIYRGNTYLLGRTYFKKPPVKSELKYIGRVTMFVSIAPFVTAIVALFGDENTSIIPAGVTLIIVFILSLVIGIKIFKNE